jgi:anti-sigma28 factor (negative regulator of flagellin synthesis)
MTNSIENAEHERIEVEQTSVGNSKREINSVTHSAGSAVKADNEDQVTLSYSAHHLEQIPHGDNIKIKIIQQNIADRLYQIDAERLVEKLLATEELLP